MERKQLRKAAKDANVSTRVVVVAVVAAVVVKRFVGLLYSRDRRLEIVQSDWLWPIAASRGRGGHSKGFSYHNDDADKKASRAVRNASLPKQVRHSS